MKLYACLDCGGGFLTVLDKHTVSQNNHISPFGIECSVCGCKCFNLLGEDLNRKEARKSLSYYRSKFKMKESEKTIDFLYTMSVYRKATSVCVCNDLLVDDFVSRVPYYNATTKFLKSIFSYD